MDCEIVILVENIDICRYFYRETLGLGEPELDSNFQVIFRLSESAVLVLEQCGANYLEHSSGACRFVLDFPDPAALILRMQKNGTPLVEDFNRYGKKTLRGIDPEGNVFGIRC